MKDAENFKKFADNVVLFAHITSRIEGAKHANLLSEKGGRGFPHIVFMDENGDVLAKHSGPRTADGFMASQEKVTAYLELKAKAESGDASAKFDFLMARIGLGNVTLAEVKKETADMELDEAQKAKLAAVMVDFEVNEIGSKVRSRDQAVKAGAAFAAMLKEGRIPSDPKAETFLRFMAFTMLHAEGSGDAALFEKALGHMKEHHAGNPRLKRFLDQGDQRLAKMKAGGGDKGAAPGKGN